jgi:pyrroline-5-carboxylate reductase
MNQLNNVLDTSGQVTYITETNMHLLHEIKTKGIAIFGTVVGVLDDLLVCIGKTSPHL